MKNKITDLNNHLFAQMERLGNEDLSGEQLTSEIERSKAVANVAKEIISGGKLQLDAEREFGRKGEAPKMLAVQEAEQS